MDVVWVRKPTLLFHWSPVDRRKSIRRYGLKPGSRSVSNLWRPPYVCLARSPSLAWVLRGGNDEIPEWDLWTVWDTRLGQYSIIKDDDGSIKEYRVYERIYKRDLWYVGMRSSTTSGWRD